MREIVTQIEINAPAQRVWQILLDFDRYPQWNPFIKNISGEAKAGGRLNVRIHPPNSRAMTFKPTVLKAEPDRELRWLGRLLIPGLFDGEHRFVIEPIDENRVFFTHAERFNGLLVPLLWKSLDTQTREGFMQMNAALKKLAES
ncbi:MAG: SRPBCC domain-containing protein [Acidobacteriota bacterium]